MDDLNPTTPQEKAIKKEFDAWSKLGVDPWSTINVPGSIIEIRIVALTNYMIKKGLIDEDEMNLEFQETLVKELQRHRHEVEKQVIQAKARASIIIPEMHRKAPGNGTGMP